MDMEQWFRDMPMYQFDFLISFVGFLLFRYTMANKILGIKLELKTGLVLSLFYSVFNSVRSWLIHLKERNADSAL